LFVLAALSVVALAAEKEDVVQKISDAVGNIDFEELEETIQEQLSKRIKSIDIEKIVAQRVQERMKQIKFDEAIQREIDAIVDTEVTQEQLSLIDQLKSFKDQLWKEFREMQEKKESKDVLI